jgi:hypothetical protein
MSHSPPHGRLHSYFYSSAQGVVLHVPANRAVNNHGDGALFDRSQFHYDESTDTYRCPGDQMLARQQLERNKTRVIDAGDPAVCNACALNSRCTNTAATGRQTTPPRRSSATHAAARGGGDDALTTIHRGAPLRLAEVPHLRKCTVSASWSAGSTGRDQPGHPGLQLETHVERSRRNPTSPGLGREMSTRLAMLWS